MLLLAGSNFSGSFSGVYKRCNRLSRNIIYIAEAHILLCAVTIA